ncbi:MAG: triose-phosphate isomerase [Pseudomonadales bacterium]
MRAPMVAANWKMNGSGAICREFVEHFDVDGAVDVVLFPPFLYTTMLVEGFAERSISVGVQNVCNVSSGAYTGEIGAEMAVDSGATFGLVGHSERRNLFSETDVVVAEKFVACQRAGLTPILCVGESLEDRLGGRAETVVAEQIDSILKIAGITAFATAVIAYEPVWAIGTGKTASPDQAQAMHAFIRAFLAISDANTAKNTRVLYGGSVKADNASELFAETDIDGGLVGGASLEFQEFTKICRAASR